MEQSERIAYLEERFVKGREAVDNFEKALMALTAAQKGMAELSEYFRSPERRADRAALNEGKLSADIGANVLSDEAVPGLLTDNHELIAEMLEKAAKMVRVTP